MTMMPWVKMYVEILDDVKLARLSDSQRWRFVQFILLAAECDAAGALVTGDSPMTHAELSWRLRCDESVIGQDITKMVQVGLLSIEDDTVIVTNFANRQGPSQEEKRKQWRERQQKRRSRVIKADVTQESPVSHADVTPLEKSREDKEKEVEVDSEPPPQFQEPEAWKDDPTIDPPAPTPAPYIHPSRKAQSLLLKCGRMAAIPAKDIPRVEQVLSMIDTYGETRVGDALTEAFRKWISTPRKNGGGNYSPLNFGWVDWAQEALMDVGADVKPAYRPNMSKEELMRYLGVKPE